jgi:RimJ/RimL family protein N-acetyltransferase
VQYGPKIFLKMLKTIDNVNSEMIYWLCIEINKSMEGNKMYTGKIIIKETDETDLQNIMNLWNNTETMQYVWPGGIGCDIKYVKNCIERIKNDGGKHFSIYTDENKYCGETGYGIKNIEDENSGLEIKLLPEVQGKGIAEYVLHFIIKQIKNLNEEKYFCNRVWVDPHKENEKALKLYNKLGFKETNFPKYLLMEDDGNHIYMELKLKKYKNEK